jgi:methionyl-tRNA formyltransferase
VRGVHCLRALLGAKEPVTGVVGQAGSEASELAKLAAGAGLPFRAPKGPNGDETLAWARGLGCRLAVMSGYAKIVRKPFLDVFTAARSRPIAAAPRSTGRSCGANARSGSR